MQPDQTQDSSPQPQQAQNQAQDPTKQANTAAANLGFINTMQEHLLKYKASKDPQNAPQQEQTQNPSGDMKTEIKASESRIMKEIKGLKDEFSKNSSGNEQKEVERLKKEIEEVLKQDE